MVQTVICLLVIGICLNRLTTSRREQLWAGLLMVPLIVPTIFFRTTFLLDSREGLIWFVQSIVGLFAVGVVAGALYARFVHPHVTPYLHPHRAQLQFLLPVPLLVGWLVTQHVTSFAVGVSCALIVTATAAAILWRGVFWDVLYASLGMSVLYVIGQLAFMPSMPGEMVGVWFTKLSGVVVLNQPVEHILSAALFGLLWGPLYTALKGNPDVRAHFVVSHTKAANRLVKAKQLVTATVLLSIIGAGVTGAHFFASTPVVLAAGATTDAGSIEHSLDLAGQLRITFSHPVDRQRLRFAITPAVQGSWHYANPLTEGHFFREALFVPDESFDPGVTYRVDVTGIAGVFSKQEDAYSFEVVTKALPEISAVSVSPGQVDVPICDAFEVSLDQPRTKWVNFDFTLEPAAPLVIETLSDTTYRLKPESCLAQNAQYTLVVNRTLLVNQENATDVATVEEVHRTSFTTKPAPGIKGSSPTGSQVVPKQVSEISVQFSQAMDTSADLPAYMGISPSVPGSWKWVGEDVAMFVPSEGLSFDTRYVVTASKGMPDSKGGFLDADARMSFTTIGPAKVVRTSPVNGAGGVKSSTTVQVVFNQAVNAESAQAAFSISPQVSGSFSWKDSTMSFAGTLAKDTEYKVTVAAGVVSVNGQPSTQPYSLRFTTEESVTLLSVPLYYQEKSLSCEVASLKMALAYRGVSVSENELMSHIGYDPTPRDGNVWGDPDVAFVGSITGKQNTTGYGVHWGPIAKSARNYRSATAFSGWSAADLAKTLAEGNPVVMWGIYPGGSRDSWTTPSGRTIASWKGEHVRTVIGFSGPAENPRAFYTNDPVAGRQKWTTSQFLANWATFGNSGVVVY